MMRHTASGATRCDSLFQCWTHRA